MTPLELVLLTISTFGFFLTIGGLILIAVFAAILGAILAIRKNRNPVGWSLLCLLLPFCVFFLMALWPLPGPEAARHDCPLCLEPVLVGARICKHCQSDLQWSEEDLPYGGQPAGERELATATSPIRRKLK
jgi:hypothetical protein